MIAEALMCMALNIYHEAKNQSMLGQIAVGQVVMNRVEDRRFPNTVCEVVKQRKRGVCQFSWFCDGNGGISTASFAVSYNYGIYASGNVANVLSVECPCIPVIGIWAGTS